MNGLVYCFLVFLKKFYWKNVLIFFVVLNKFIKDFKLIFFLVGNFELYV